MKKSVIVRANDVALAVHYGYGKKSMQAVRKEMLNMPDVMSKLGYVDKSIFIATTEKAIGQYSDKDLIEAAEKTFYWITIDIGLRDTKSREWKLNLVRICDLLKKYFPTMTMQDIKMAFELVVIGELNDYLPKNKQGAPDKDHYQLFNADYVFRILKSYQIKRKEVINKAMEAVSKPVLPEDKKVKDYYGKLAKEDAIYTFACYKHHNWYIAKSTIKEKILYDVLFDVGLIAPIEITEYEQKIIFKRTLNEYASQMMSGAYKMLKDKGLKAEEIQFEALLIARRRAIKEAFDNIIDDDINIRDYIKF